MKKATTLVSVHVPFISQKNKQSNFKKKWKYYVKEKKSNLSEAGLAL